MKRILWIAGLVIIIVAGIAAWIFLGPGTGFREPKKALYIRSDAATKKAVLDSLEKNEIIGNETAFNFLADQMDYWDGIKPGKYEIKKGSSLVSIVRMLRRGQQTPVDLVINKYRLKEDFARAVGRKFETDSTEMMAFLNNNDSLKKYDAEPELAMWNVLPDTYTYFWNSTPNDIYKKIHEYSEKFWNQERKNKAAALGLTPQQVYILASIIEEETTRHSEKDTIASVYLNRLKKGMTLGADPTLKFATRQFALKRVIGILDVESPYNTYRNKGLPPGPICTPSKLTIDKVLNPATTDFLFFVAKPGLGGHLFSVTYEEHLRKRDDYIRAQHGDENDKNTTQ
jgi:UPF0755 protein